MDQPDLARPQRDHWAGRGAFILAAIGSAVGLGNLWGFPYKLYTFGGGAFLIPYFLAMLVMGIPLLIMEFSVGHWAQQSPPGAFGRVRPRSRSVQVGGLVACRGRVHHHHLLRGDPWLLCDLSR